MGIFDRLQDELAKRERQEGVSPLDVLELSAPLRELLATLARSESMSLEEVMTAASLEREEAQELLDSLVDRGFARTVGDPGAVRYKRYLGQRRARSVSLDIWESLSDRLVSEEEDES
jgi:hypothetical protein